MSHFFTAVVVPEQRCTEDFVATLLAPYDENRDVGCYAFLRMKT